LKLNGVKSGIIMAMPIEAEPFIQGLGMEPVETWPFPLYRLDDIFLMVTGIGRVRASAASAYLISRYNPDIMINMGTAGSNVETIEAGRIFSINTVYDGDLALYRGPEYFEYVLETFTGLDTAALLTSDRPSITAEERVRAAEKAELSDMEGSSFAHVCGLFNKEAYIFKIVSDGPGSETFKSIREGIVKYSGDMFGFFKSEIFGKN